MGEISWVHISDLHFGDDTEFSRNARNSLLEELKRYPTIDYLFITGDIIYANKKKESEKRKAYKDAEIFLKDLYKAIWNKEYSAEDFFKHVFMVPGNHDVCRDDERESAVESMIRKYRAGTQGKIASSFVNNSKNSLKLYSAFYKKLYGNSKNGKSHFIETTDKINILGIFTTISSGRDHEEGDLIVGYDLLSKEISKRDSEKPTIALAHHSLEVLDYQEQKKTEALLKNNGINLYLCGHSHERESNLILKENQKTILNVFTSGALLAEDKGFIDTVYYYGKMDLESLEGHIYSYKWTLSSGWHSDDEFGYVQGPNNRNERTFRSGSIDVPSARVITPNTKDIMEGVISKIVGHTSSERQIAFIDVNDKVKDSISVYGVGITHVSKDKALLKRVLDNNGIVRLCMVDPCIFKQANGGRCFSPVCNISDLNFCIYATHMNQYVRDEYVDDVKSSYDRIMKLKSAFNNDNFKVRLLRSFVPISINIVNEGHYDKAELVVEYNMPFVEKRLLIRLKQRDDNNYYTSILNAYEQLWENAIEV